MFHYPPRETIDFKSKADLINYLKEKFQNLDLYAVLNDSNPLPEFSRLRAWEDCYLYFRTELPNAASLSPDSPERQAFLDEASCRLSSYLAIFGMYRGSGFIMQYRAAIFRDVINGFLNTFSKEDISNIYTKNRLQNNNDFLNKITSIINSNLKQFYNINAAKKNNKSKDSDVCDLLITKIILGIFCLTPAIDSKVVNCIQNIKQNIPGNRLRNTSNIDLLLIISDLCLETPELRSLLSKACPCFYNTTEPYPLIRALDLALWK